MTAMLASVRSAAEAGVALQAGADIIDVKEPSGGALGAAPLAEIAGVVQRVSGRRPVSATVGDLPGSPALVGPAVERTAAAGVDIVKVGLFEGAANDDLLCALSDYAARGVRIVLVMFADRALDWTLFPRVAQCGLYGVMLDTADKAGGSLCRRLEEARIARFVSEVRSLGLLVGLAGSLGADDVAPLLALQPDYLGFRGALCGAPGRTGALDPAAARRIRTLIPGACHQYKGPLKRSTEDGFGSLNTSRPERIAG